MDEIIIVLEGGLKEEVDGEILNLKAGDFLLTKAGSMSRKMWAEDGTVAIVIKAPSIPTDKHIV